MKVGKKQIKYKPMSHLLEQQKDELAVFDSFMQICGYPIIKGSILQQTPPSPDILCKPETGDTIEFELTNSIDCQLAQKMNDCRVSDKGGFNNYDPIEGIVRDKIDKLNKGKYTLRGQRFELLVYLGLMFVYPYQRKAIPKFLEEIKHQQGFDKIWIFRDDQLNPEILWSMERKIT